MSKINAIYSALDSGNARSAVRLCDQFLTKGGGEYSGLVSALMALGLSRMGESESALKICSDLLEKNPDESVCETMGYVLKREGRFDLLSRVLDHHSEGLIALYICKLQSLQFEELPGIALKLVKQFPNEKCKYLLWYAFGLSFLERGYPLGIATLNKLGESILLDDNCSNASRWTVGGRFALYFSLFKIQFLAVKMARYQDAISEVENCNSAMISCLEKDALISDLNNRMTDMASLPENTHECAPAEMFLVEEMKNMTRFYTPNDQSFDEKFHSLFVHYLNVSIDRSDCLIVLCEFLPFARFGPKIIPHLEKILCREGLGGRALVTLYKLLYAFGGRIDVHALTALAHTHIANEHVLDECSPGKQLLLLSAIIHLQNGDLLSSVALLEFGSMKFLHCSHFRLIECVVYANLGLTKKAIERFEALGIKNAQWNSLFWLIEKMISQNFVCVSKRDEISQKISAFQKHHRIEIAHAMELMVEEGAFYKWPILESAARSFGGNDYSPLLFISILEIGSMQSTSLVQQQNCEPRVAGFMWEAPKQTTPKLRLSPSLIIGELVHKMVAPLDTCVLSIDELFDQISTNLAATNIMQIVANVHTNNKSLILFGSLLNGKLETEISQMDGKKIGEIYKF